LKEYKPIKKMHIIHITASYKPAYIYGGPIRSVATLCENLVKANINTEVLTTTANGKTELDVKTNKIQINEGVPVTYFKRLTKDHSHFSPALLWRLHKQLKANKKDTVLHVHAWWNLVSVLSCLIAKWHQTPVILSPRGMLTEYTFGNRNSISKNIIHFILGKSLLNYCHFHATSLKEKNDIEQMLSVKDISIIPNLIHLPANIQRKNSQKGSFKIIFLSRIEEKKGLELLLDALSDLPINWSLTIAGSGEDNYVDSLKKYALKISNNINWIGQVKDETKFDLLAEHDLMALTSYNENFANVVLESLNVGTPVLLSKEVGLADYVAENHFGWITDLNKDAIKNNLILAFESLAQRENINKIAPYTIKNDFNASSVTKKYLTLYQKILSE
jgi:glycosyltransferase involved in cell wall biosynthesis